MIGRGSGRRKRWWDWHGQILRDPLDVFAGGAAGIAANALQMRIWGRWNEALASLRGSLIVTREYEHLVVALKADGERTSVSYIHLPHPSGVLVDAARRAVHIACSRNPNQLMTLTPAVSPACDDVVLIPHTATFLPGRLHLHDLALIGGRVYAAATGINAIVRIEAGRAVPVWWPEAADDHGKLRAERNHLQLNSIAAGATLASSHFTASTDRIGSRSPGDPRFRVNGRGVVFSGRTREPVVRGLTRPHSAVQARGRVWLNNSGYGEVGFVEQRHFQVVARLRGWTRGLAFGGGYAFVGISRILPRFEAYAPGLRPEDCRCGIEVVELRTGRVVGGLWWPAGNQIFAVAVLPERVAAALPFAPGRGSVAARSELARDFVRLSGAKKK